RPPRGRPAPGHRRPPRGRPSPGSPTTTTRTTIPRFTDDDDHDDHPRAAKDHHHDDHPRPPTTATTTTNPRLTNDDHDDRPHVADDHHDDHPRPPTTAPSALTGVSAVAQDDQVTVSWSAPNDGGSPITSCTVTPCVGGLAQTPHTFGSSAKSQTVSGLIDGTSCTFTALATNAAGSSARHRLEVEIGVG